MGTCYFAFLNAFRGRPIARFCIIKKFLHILKLGEQHDY